MADPTTQDLRDELRRRTDVVVPPPPIQDILARAVVTKRSRSRRLIVVAAAGVAAAVGIGAAVTASTGSRDGTTPSKNPSGTSTPTPTPIPQTLEDLPMGKASSFIHVSGRTVILGSDKITLPRRPHYIYQSGTSAVVLYDDFSIVAVDVPSGATHQIAGKESGIPVVGPGGWIAFDKAGSGYPRVVVEHLTPQGVDSAREATFPAFTQCCTDPFYVFGIDSEGLVIGGSTGETFSWRSRGTASDPTPGEVIRVRGLGDRYPDSVTKYEVVLDGGNGYEAGQILDGDRFVVNERFATSGAVNVEDPTTVLYDGADGKIHAATRKTTFNVPGLQVLTGRLVPRDVTLEIPLPEENLPNFGGFDDQASWEDSEHVVFDLTKSDNGVQRDVQIRCDVFTGKCRIASWY